MMFQGSAVFGILLVLLSGCLASTGDGAPREIPAVTSVVEESHPLKMSEQNLPGSTSTSGRNCLLLDSKYRILRGSVELSWQSDADLTQELRLYGAESERHVFADSGLQRSPISVEFGEVSRQNDIGEFSFLAMLGKHGIMVDQPATMKIRLEVAGDEKPVLTEASCFLG